MDWKVRIKPAYVTAGDVAQATFATEAMLQQHNEGPTHRKTLARLQAQQEKKRRMGHHSGAAEAALVCLECPALAERPHLTHNALCQERKMHGEAHSPKRTMPQTFAVGVHAAGHSLSLSPAEHFVSISQACGTCQSLEK